MSAPPSVELGLGLVSIGRLWGVADPGIPGEQAALDLLDAALALGIRLFDTAPAYGSSEARLGRFLARLDPAQRGRLVIATKCGEHWDDTRQSPFADHGYDALCRSIDRSLALLGRIDLLPIHKTTEAVLASPDLDRTLDHAHGRGIARFGASVSDLATALAVCGDRRLSAIQLPFNRDDRQLEPALARAAARGLFVLINRPFGMGKFMQESKADNPAQTAFRAILEQDFAGAVLSGTRSPAHLRQNLAAFRAAQAVSP